MNKQTRKTVFASSFALAMVAGISTSALAQTTSVPTTPGGPSGAVTPNPANSSTMGGPMDSDRPLTTRVGDTTGSSGGSTLDGLGPTTPGTPNRMGTSNPGTSVSGEVRVISSTRFGGFDTNGDGRLSRDEMRGDVRLSGDFDSMDSNKDGYLSKEETAPSGLRAVTKAPVP